ncbi:pilus assembly protein TadG-related protein [Burkholderia multivorans]|uniref:pilus assembly protein TadG-related protein n=1 Tax=Burkholderia multivorans TaxID=87883 RepID=UPI0009BF0A10|nr:pilus assembly protein TadG-related protein [Burkholderia multivorans]
MRAHQSHRGMKWTGAPERRLRQRGSIAVIAAIWVAVAVIVLGGIDIGRFYAERRHMQAAADLAALSAVQYAAVDSTCQAAKAAALQVANPSANRVPADATIAVTCGVWSAPASGGSALFTRTAGDPIGGQCGGLSAGTVNGQATNAVCVSISESVNGFFRPGGQIGASALAKSTPTDTFTLTTSLAQLNGGLVNQLLGTLTQSPNPLQLQVADYQGLAQVNVKMADVLANLPVGSNTSVLDGSVKLGQLLNAELQAATSQKLLGANLNVLNAIVAALCQGNTCGGPDIALGKLVAVAAAGGNSAVDASVNALGLLSTALQIANAESSIDIPSLQLTTPPPLGPLVKATVQGSVKLAGVHPATASGPPGPSTCGTLDCATNTWTSQGTVSLNASLSLLSTCSDGSLAYGDSGCPSGNPISVAKVQLPVTVSVASASAGLVSVVCSASQKVATVNVQPGVLTAYIGGSATPDPNSSNSGYMPDSGSSAAPIQLASVNLSALLNLLAGTQSPIGPLINTLSSLLNTLTLGAVDLKKVKVTISLKPGQLTVPVADQSPTRLRFTSSDSSPYTAGPVSTSQFLAPASQGIANSGLLVTLTLIDDQGLLGMLLKHLGIDLNSVLNQLLSNLTTVLLPALGNTIIPLLLQPIDSALTSITGLLGLGLGNVYVTNTPDSIKCGNPMLVH